MYFKLRLCTKESNFLSGSALCPLSVKQNRPIAAFLVSERRTVTSTDVPFHISIKASSHIACRAHAVLRPCHAISFVKVRVVAGKIQTANPTV
jgi:hypothetical protein